MTHELSSLPYAYDTLEPYIDARTMEIHHDKHHAAYVNNLNTALSKHSELEGKSLDELIADLNNVPADIRNAVRNNGGGHWNHTFFWNVMGKNEGDQPKGNLAEAIQKDFGSFVGENCGYAVYEGTEVEVANTMQQYVPYCIFKMHPVAYESQVNEIIKGLTG